MTRTLLFLLLLLTSISEAALSDPERQRLRFRLENLWNEIDLTLRNSRSRILDLQRLEKEMNYFRVLERFPLREDLEALEGELILTAREHRLQIHELKAISRQPVSRPVPEELFTDERKFEFAEDQLAQKITLRIRGKGSLHDVQKWISAWDEQIVRWIEPLNDPRDAKPGSFEVRAATYRFRDVRFPRLKYRDPLSLLPPSARKNPDRFSEQERQLWSFVTRIRDASTKAEAATRTRENFLLASARMSYFIKKTQPKGRSVPEGPAHRH